MGKKVQRLVGGKIDRLISIVTVFRRLSSIPCNAFAIGKKEKCIFSIFAQVSFISKVQKKFFYTKRSLEWICITSSYTHMLRERDKWLMIYIIMIPHDDIVCICIEIYIYIYIYIYIHMYTFWLLGFSFMAYQPL